MTVSKIRSRWKALAHCFVAILVSGLLDIPSISYGAENGQTAAAVSRVINGINHPVADFPAVVRIVHPVTGGYVLGSGTLIAPGFVLTAAHVAYNLPADALTLEINGSTYHSTAIYGYPGYYLNTDINGPFDAAVIALDRQVNDVSPSPIYRRMPDTGAAVTIVGYGLQADGMNPVPGTVNSGTNTIESVTAHDLLWDWSPDSGTSSCYFGDSGGPAYINVNGILTVAGIASWIASDPSHPPMTDVYTRVDVIAGWIDSIISPPKQPPAISAGPAVTPLIAEPGQPMRFTVSATDPDGTGLSYLWDFGDGFTDSGSNVVEHTYNAVGLFYVQLTLVNGEGLSTIAHVTAVVTVAPPTEYAPVIVSDPTAIPNPALTGQAITFSAAGEDLNGGAVSYQWDFGDGTQDTSATTSHSYSSSGWYTARITVTGTSGLFRRTSILIIVTDPPSSTPSIPSPTLSIKTFRANLTTHHSGNRCSIGGILLNVPAATQFSNTTAVVTLNAQTASFSLNGNGKARSTLGQFALRAQAHQGNFSDGDVPFTIEIKNGNWARELIFDGTTQSTTVRIYLQITLAGASYQISFNTTYRKTGSGGVLSLLR